MALIAKTKLKIPSSLTIVQRDYPIGAQMMTRSKVHIIGSKTGISQILKDDVVQEGGDTEEEIDKFTSAPEGFTQPSSQAQARGPDHLDRLIARVEQMYYARIPRAAHHRSVYLCQRLYYCLIVLD